MNCPNCGNSNPETSTFCAYCGTGLEPVTASQEPTPASAAPEAAPDFFAAETMVIDPIPETAAATAVEEAPKAKKEPKAKAPKAPKEKKEKKSKGAVIAAIILAVLLAAAIAAGVYFYLGFTAALAESQDTVAQLQQQVADLEAQNADQAAALEAANTQLETQTSQLSEQTEALDEATAAMEEQLLQLEEAAPKADSLDRLLGAMASFDTLGTASDSFFAKEKMVILTTADLEEPLEITCKFNTTEDVELHAFYELAEEEEAAILEPSILPLTGDADSFRIVPQHAGVTVVEIGNNLNEETFQVVLMVTE